MRKQRKARGWVLLAALVLAVITAMIVVAVIVYSSSSRILAHTRGESEAAYLVADGGIDDEINYITNHMYDPVITNRSSQPVVQTGQPHMGRPGTIPNVRGSFWVYSSAVTADPINQPSPWTGIGPVEIVSTGLVNKSIRTIVVTSWAYSIFDTFGFFAINSTDRTNPAVSLSGSNTVVTVNGTAGTNGRVQRGNSTVTYTTALNANAANWGPTDQFTTGQLYTQQSAQSFPSVTQIIKQTFPAAASMSDAAAWSYLQNTVAQNSAIRMWKPGLPSGSSLTLGNTMSAGIPNSLVSLTNKQGNNLGAWQNANYRPGSTTVQTLIFPPGDYYFNSLNLVYNANTEWVIDNAGLSVGGNPNALPIRIWMSTGGGSSDSISLPIILTNAGDVSTLRFYYNKDAATLSFVRDSGMTGNLVVNGGVYAVSGGSKGTAINFTGSSSPSGQVVLNGSLIADHLGFGGHSTINFPGSAIENPNDPGWGVAFTGGYSEN